MSHVPSVPWETKSPQLVPTRGLEKKAMAEAERLSVPLQETGLPLDTLRVGKRTQERGDPKRMDAEKAR